MISLLWGWSIFRAQDLIQAGVMLKRMIMPWEYTGSPLLADKLFGNKTIIVIWAGILGCGLFQVFLCKVKMIEKLRNSYLDMIYCSVIFIICIAILASNTYNPFIYYRF